MKYKGTFIVLVFFLSFFSVAGDSDDEIIKNLDFFQSMEMIKDDRSFAVLMNEKNEKKEQNSLKSSSEKGAEKKQ